MPGFEELGLSAAVVANAREEGFDAPSGMQRSIIPVMRRGGNAIVRASSGSGVTAAYAMALVDRLSTGDATQALVVVPTVERAERVAATIARMGAGTNVRATALTSAWARSGKFNVTVASAEQLLNAIEDSQLRLEDVDVVVVDGAAVIEKLASGSLETLFATLPREGQRVFIANELTDEVRKVAESHARKALYFPPRPAVEAEGESGGAGERGKIRYAVASGGRKTDIIARLSQSADALTVVCRSSAAARRAERELSARGFDVSAVTYDDLDRGAVTGTVVAYDAPFTAEQLQGFRDGDIVIVERNELPHLKTIAQDAGIRLESASLPAYETDSLNSFRNEIRRAAKEEDLEAQMLVLEPLFREMSPEEIAAAATALLRARRPLKSEPRQGKGVKTWARLFLSIGERDGIRPHDLVGAITGETGVKGDDVGRVDIRDTFSVIEVASDAADKVIRGLNGTTMKNRALRVDYDRKTAPERARGPKKSGPRPTRPTGRKRP